MKVFAWVMLLVEIVCTIFYVHSGLTLDRELPWLNGWMAGPIALLFMTPISFIVPRMIAGASLSGGVPRQFRGAPIGIGRITGIARTGLVVNGRPQLDLRLEIDTQDGRTVAGMARQFVDVLDLPTFQPGAVLPVHYLPDGRATFAADALPHELQAAMDQIQLAKGLVTPKQLHIAQNGIEAQAVVLAMAPTGEVRLDRSVVHLTLRVTRPDGSMFDVPQEKAVPSNTIPQLQPGSVVRVKYLPYDESEVVVIARFVP